MGPTLRLPTLSLDHQVSLYGDATETVVLASEILVNFNIIYILFQALAKQQPLSRPFFSCGFSSPEVAFL